MEIGSEEFADCLLAGVDVAIALFDSEGSVWVVVRRRCADVVETFGRFVVEFDVGGGQVKRPGFDGGSDSTERWSSASTKEVPARIA